MRKISVNQLTTMRWSFEEDIVSYSKLGIEQVGICRVKANELGIEKSKDLLDECGISVSSYGCSTFFSELTGPTLDDQIWQTRKDLEDAATLGARNLILHTGGAGRHLRKNRFCAAEKSLNRLLPVAEEYGVSIAIEPMCQFKYSHSLNDCVQLINQFDSEMLGMTLDLYHVGNSALYLNSDWVQKHVRLIQLSDFRETRHSRIRCPMGTGELQLQDYCRMLDQTGFAGPCEFELYGEGFDFVSYEKTLFQLAHEFTRVHDPSIEFESLKA